tara:strand:+ start:5909 stop:7267 length:1359 start_codon:yes stop_codon:yes gene_type:complete
MKKILFISLILLLIPLTTSANLEVTEIESKNVIMRELDNNATYKLSIKNLDSSDEFQIYTLISAVIYPKNFFSVNEGEEIQLDLTIVPHQSTINNNLGTYTFEYQIKGQKTGFFKNFISLKILEAKDAISVSIKNIALEDTTAEIEITNEEDFNFEDVKVSISSDFFQYSEILDFSPKEKKQISIPIDKSKNTEAGDREFISKFELNGIISKKTNILKYLEKGGISISEKSEGLIIRKTDITKTNEGNIPTKAIIESKKNILTRLFTVYSETPDTSKRKGLFVHYSWEKELGVGESLEVSSTTNYTFPLILLILVIAVVIATKIITRKNLSLSKRASLLKTRGGEFAVKVKLKIKSNKPASNITISDKLPRMTKLYTKHSKPHHIDSKSRNISWEIKHLSPGEQRVFTYIIYSKINPVGSFELSPATASYESEGAKEFSYSNATSIATETAD